MCFVMNNFAEAVSDCEDGLVNEGTRSVANGVWKESRCGHTDEAIKCD